MPKLLAAIVLCLSIFVSAAIAQKQERDPTLEAPILEKLKAAAPGSAETFVAATKALDADKFAEAEQLYSQVLEKAPDFDPALRRKAYALAGLGKRVDALALTEKALSHERSVDNLVGRVSVLFNTADPSQMPSSGESSEALALSREAWSKSNEADEGAGTYLVESLLAAEKYDEFTIFAKKFREKFPNSMAAVYYNAVALANTGEYNAAEAELDRLTEMGAPPESTTAVRTAMNEARDAEFFGLGRYRTIGYVIAGLILLWAVGLLVLFVGGRTLSAKTLKAIETSDPNDIAGAEHSSLKKLYRRIISIAGFYYYISQPFVIFLVIAIAGGIILGFLWVGTIPIKLVAIIGFVAVGTVFYMIKSLFTRLKPEDPGRVLTETEAPGLWQLTRDVASMIGTRPVNEIRITQGTDLAVYERGNFRAKMADKAERILILGTAVLNGFDLNAFRAVLAHEYGHFSNRDTAGGDIAFRVNIDILRTADAMLNAGTAKFYNFGFQFLRLFHFIFRRITLGASRLQEVLADRVAAYFFGSEAFKNGLDHVIRSEIEFNHIANKEISAALGASRPLQNLYEMTVQEDAAVEAIDEQFSSAIDRDTTDDDSHPSPRDRYRFIERIRTANVETLSGDVWSLFADPSAIKAEMNTLIEGLVRGRRGTNEDSILHLG